MATNDIIKYAGADGNMRYMSLHNIGLTWPPPEELTLEGKVYTRSRMSQLTDGQADEMPFIARGAEYVEKVDG